MFTASCTTAVKTCEIRPPQSLCCPAALLAASRSALLRARGRVLDDCLREKRFRREAETRKRNAVQREPLLEVFIGVTKIGKLRFPFSFGGGDFFLARAGFQFGDMCGHLIAARAQFGGVQFGDRLAGLKRFAFLRENFFHTSAVARSDANLVGFNRAGDGIRVGVGIAAGQEQS